MMRVAKNPEFARLMGRMYGEGLMPLIVERHFQTVVTRSFAALARALPHLTPGELALRLQFMTGSMAHILMGKALDSKAIDRKSTRLNSSHLGISYAVF